MNAWKIPELRKKILFTLMMFAVFRLGSHIPVPGINSDVLAGLFNSDLFSWMDILSGGSFKKLSLFAMGIIPYINASIIIQLMTMVVPYFERLAKEGQDGRRKMSQWIRYGAIVLGFAQAAVMSIYLKSAMVTANFWSFLVVTLSLTAGTALIMWIGEAIT
ncbi:MAG: preprotein translocase subunit SecY, partial [Clostridiales bacterium]